MTEEDSKEIRAVFFVCIASTAVSVAAWLAGYAVGVADGTRPLAEWCRRHMDTDWGQR